MTRRIRYLANSAWILADKVGLTAISFLVTALVARHLGPTDFGQLAYIFALVAIAGSLGHLGLDGLLVRELVKKLHDTEILLGTVVTLRCLVHTAMAVILITYALTSVALSQPEVALYVAAALFILINPARTLQAWFESRVEARLNSFAAAPASLASNLVRLLFVFAGMPVAWFAFARSIEPIARAIALIALFKRNDGPRILSLRYSNGLAKSLLKESWMIYLGSLFAAIYLKIDLVMLKFLDGDMTVGQYAVAAQISEATFLIPGAIVASVYPRLVEINRTSTTAFNQQFAKLLDVLAFSGLFIAGLLIASSYTIIAAVYGSEYKEASSMLAIHLCATPFIFLRLAFSRWILLKNRPYISLFTQGVGALANVMLNLALIPIYGGIGAALATVFSYMCASFLSLALLRETRTVFISMTRALTQPWRGAIALLKK